MPVVSLRSLGTGVLSQEPAAVHVNSLNRGGFFASARDQLKGFWPRRFGRPLCHCGPTSFMELLMNARSKSGEMLKMPACLFTTLCGTCRWTNYLVCAFRASNLVADAEADSLCRSLCSLGHQLLVGTLQTFLIDGQGLKALHYQLQCLDTVGRPWN